MRLLWISQNPPPWTCAICGGEVTLKLEDQPASEVFELHHEDLDPENIDFANLVPTHSRCRRKVIARLNFSKRSKV